MTLHVDTNLSCRMDLSDRFPEDFPGTRLLDQHFPTYHFPQGYLNIQEIRREGYTLYYPVLHTKVQFPYTLTLPRYSLLGIFALDGNFDLHTTNQAFHIPMMHWMFLKDDDKITLTNTGQTGYQAFILLFQEKIEREMMSLFPSFQNGFSTTMEKYLQTPCYLPFDTLEHFHSILHCKYEKQWKEYFIDNRVEDILLSLLVSLSGSSPLQTLSPDDKEKIIMAEKILTTQYHVHHNIEELAARSGMSQTKFKQLFKDVFKVSPGEYQRKIRLRKAVEYLEAGYSVKESAYKTGWRPAVFIEAFKEVYQTTPRKYLKGSRPKS